MTRRTLGENWVLTAYRYGEEDHSSGVSDSILPSSAKKTIFRPERNRTAGIVVVRSDGKPISFRQSIVRNLLRVVDGMFSYAVGLAVMLVTDDRQRIGDLAADTVVVHAR